MPVVTSSKSLKFPKLERSRRESGADTALSEKVVEYTIRDLRRALGSNASGSDYKAVRERLERRLGLTNPE